MTVKEFKKENNWSWKCPYNAFLSLFQNCNNCHHRSIVYLATPVTDMRGRISWVSGESKLVCRACGSRGFNTYAGFCCKAWEGEK